jgi:hypothetical protein
VWESKRENLPNEVQNGVIYRNARVRLRIATEISDSDRGFQDSLDQEGVRNFGE